jgi:hypothetical protein
VIRRASLGPIVLTVFLDLLGFYQTVGHSAPHVAAAVGMLLAGVLAIDLHAPAPAKPGSSEPQTT